MQSRLNLVVLTVALVALGVAGYTVTQSQTPPASSPVPAPRVSLEEDLRELEARVAELEAFEPPAASTDIDPRILERLEDLDRRMKGVGTFSPVRGGHRAVPEAPGGRRDAGRLRKNATRIDKTLEGLGIALSDEQRVRLVEAYAAFADRRNEIWSEAKKSGAAEGPGADWPRIIADTRERVERELVERISPIIGAGDAETIARSLLSGGK